MPPERWVFIVGAPAEVDRLWELGIVATCSPGGRDVVRTWTVEHSRALAGRRVAVVVHEAGSRVTKGVAVFILAALEGFAESLRCVITGPQGTPGTLQERLENGVSPPELEAEVERRGGPRLSGETISTVREHLGVVDTGEHVVEGGFTGLDRLLAEPTSGRHFRVDGLIPDVGVSLLVAKPGIGKSVLAQNLALSVSRGEAFLGRTTRAATVLYLALEEDGTQVVERFRLMGATASDSSLRVWTRPAPAEAVGWLHVEASRASAGLVVIDTLQGFGRIGAVSDYATVTVFMSQLRLVARRAGTHVLALHHARRAGGERGDSALGSTGFMAGADTVIEMRATTQGMRTMWTSQRYGQAMEETVVVMDPTTYGVSLGRTRREADEERLGGAMLAFLRGLREAVEEPAILDQVEGRRERRRWALRRLVTDGLVKRTGRGRGGDPFLYEATAGD